MLKLNNGVDGLKTGWTDFAGYCLTCTKEENGINSKKEGEGEQK